MYQREETIDLGIIASEIAQWSINHYGYFVKSSNDKLEMITSFAEDLSRLPQDSIRFISKVQNEWVDNGNTRPPTIPEFLKEVRTKYNREMQENRPKLECKTSSTNYAGIWDSSSKDIESALRFMRNVYNAREVSPATKWVIRDYFTKQGYTNQQLKDMKLL